MKKIVNMDDLPGLIGQEIGTGDWFEVTQEQINQFADVTHDWQFIHVDPEKAAETMFGTTIAHGFLSLSMLTKLCEGAMLGVNGMTMGVNYGFEKVRFMTPVKVNSKIRAVVTLKDAQIKGAGKRALMNYAITVEIEGEKRPAFICEWLTMIMT